MKQSKGLIYDLKRQEQGNHKLSFYFLFYFDLFKSISI